MKILLVNYYWHPWNTSGAFRWLHISKYLEIDTVLTSKRPCKGFYDETMPQGKYKRIRRYGNCLPAFLDGLYLAIRSWFFRANIYIYTIPPESLIFGAWINQLLGRKVYVDMRDKIKRNDQKLKFMIPIYQWFYKRIKNVIVCHKFIDPSKKCIQSGYEEIELNKNVKKTNYFNKKLNYKEYLIALSFGYIENYEKKYEKELYRNGIRQRRMDGSLSMITVRHLGLELDEDWFHPDCFEFEPQPWRKVAEQWKNLINQQQ